MSDAAPWLHIVGIGEDGMDGLTPATRAVVEAADVIIGGERHHSLTPDVTAQRIAWPSPFDALIETLEAHKGQRVVVLPRVIHFGFLWVRGLGGLSRLSKSLTIRS